MKKNVSRNGLFGPRDRISKLKNKSYYPLFFVGLLIAGILFIALFVYFVAIPMVAKDFEKDEGPTIIKDNQNKNTMIEQRQDLYSFVKEHLFKIRYINQPQKLGNELICTGGIDPAGNPLLNYVYLYTFKDEDNSEVSRLNIKCENDNIFYPQLSDKYVAYVDAMTGGGGGIYYFDRKSGQSKLVKEFYGAIPKINLSQNRIIWFEQVTGDIASVYVYDILLDRLTAVNTQYGLPFVYGGVDVDGNKIIWAGLSDTDSNINDLMASGKSQLYVFDMTAGTTEKYNPDMYVFSPQIKGNIMGWLDTNNSPTAGLYIVAGNGVTKKLADAVTGYYIGDGIVVYCQNQRMFCYFVEKDLTLPLSKEDKKAMMIGGANGIVFWYDITQTYERDIVKYAEVNSSSWRK